MVASSRSDGGVEERLLTAWPAGNAWEREAPVGDLAAEDRVPAGMDADQSACRDERDAAGALGGRGGGVSSRAQAYAAGSSALLVSSSELEKATVVLELGSTVDSGGGGGGE
jgi:hypothetical protein